MFPQRHFDPSASPSVGGTAPAVDRVTAADAALAVVVDLQDRCVTHAAQWLAELMLGAAPCVADAAVAAPRFAPPVPRDEALAYALAKSLFLAQEYRRAQFTLRHATSLRSQFLHVYAIFMDGEKRRSISTTNATNCVLS